MGHMLEWPTCRGVVALAPSFVRLRAIIFPRTGSKYSLDTLYSPKHRSAQRSFCVLGPKPNIRKQVVAVQELRPMSMACYFQVALKLPVEMLLLFAGFF